MVRRNRGTSFIEVLVAMLILVVSLMAMMGLWRVNMQLTEKHADTTQAYNIGRHMMERTKRQGFQVVPEGSTVFYFDANGGSEAGSQADHHKFKVTVVVTSDFVSINGTTGVASPSPDSVRDVVVTVVRISGNVVERVTGTILVRSGV